MKIALWKKVDKKILLRLLLVSFIFVGIFFRFQKLDWGEGYFFHPDERNIASLVEKLNYSSKKDFLTTGTFAYGSFIPILSFWIIKINNNLFKLGNINDQFTSTVLLLRCLSAIFSTLAIPLTYVTGKRFFDKNVGLVASAIVAFSPGLIQAAHFGTLESFLTFLYLLCLFYLINFLRNFKLRDYLLSIILVAVASSIKINSLLLLTVVFPVILVVKKEGFSKKKRFLALALSLVFVSFLPWILSPYYLTEDFKRMLIYEQQLVRGIIDVFYTRQFIGSVPILFQFEKILPYLLNPLLVIVFPFAVAATLITSLGGKKGLLISKLLSPSLIIIYFLSILFFPNAFFYTKWTRYMVPTIPFAALIIAYFLNKFPKRKRMLAQTAVVIVGFFWSLAFASIYSKSDVRLVASEWIWQNLKNNSKILSETANVIDLPINNTKINPETKQFSLIIFDFYQLENNVDQLNQLISEIESADYILIPSRRIFGGMGQHPKQYPIVSRYYDLLFSGKLGFKENAIFTSFPSIFSFEINDEWAEETWSVFDHPVVRLYKKVSPYSKDYYESLF